MSQFASQRKEYFSSVSPSPEEERPLQRVARRPRKGTRAGSRDDSNHANALYHKIPLGAVHVDASGIVLEHRLAEAGDIAAQIVPIVGRHVGTIAPWATDPAFVSALKSAIQSIKVSFHFDFKSATATIERMIHVNILSVGDKTVWIFISDKTLALISS
jgi:hypothetical protein